MRGDSEPDLTAGCWIAPSACSWRIQRQFDLAKISFGVIVNDNFCSSIMVAEGSKTTYHKVSKVLPTLHHRTGLSYAASKNNLCRRKSESVLQMFCSSSPSNQGLATLGDLLTA